MRECEDDNNNSTQNIVSQSVYQSVRLSVNTRIALLCQSPLSFRIRNFFYHFLRAIPHIPFKRPVPAISVLSLSRIAPSYVLLLHTVLTPPVRRRMCHGYTMDGGNHSRVFVRGQVANLKKRVES
jgi:hypothetical protein